MKGEDIFVINERLKSERERLGLTQPVFAETAGVSKRTLIDWEKGVSSPTAVQLSALAAVGVDVLYVLTGQINQQAADAPALSPRQRFLLENYDQMSEEGKRIMDAAASAAAKPIAPRDKAA